MTDPLLPQPPPTPPPLAPKRARALFWLVLAPMLSVTGILAASYLLRTQPVAGPLLKAALLAHLPAAQVRSLRVESVRPWGLGQLRLDGVSVRLGRGEHEVEARMGALDVSVDWWASVAQRRLVPGTLFLRDATIVLKRGQPAHTDKDDEVPATSVDTTGLAAGLESLRLQGHHVKVELQIGQAYVTTRPMAWTRFDLEVSLKGRPRPLQFGGYGTLPDGVPFSATTVHTEEAGARRFEFQATAPTRIDQWFEDQVPFEMSTRRFAVCDGCARDVVELSPVSLRLPSLGQGVKVSAPSSTLVWVDHSAKLALSEFAIEPLASQESLLRLTESTFAVDLKTGRHSGRLGFYDTTKKGKAHIDWRWDSKDRVLSHTVVAHHFSLTPLLKLFGVDSLLEQAVVTGTSRVEVDLDDQLADATFDLVARDLQVHVDALSPQVLKFPSVSLDAQIVADVKGRSLSVIEAHVGLEGVSPLGLTGHLVDAGKGWRFEADAFATAIDVQGLQTALPEQMLDPVVGAKMRGSFDLSLSAGGHSAYPESLRLELEMGGEVEVEEDGPKAPVQALAATGVPWVGGAASQLVFPETTAHWVPLSEVPEPLVRVLTAAEDAVFFEHQGFDFGGLERAMQHNLKVGAMERGGSTITQQLTKNLYLSRRRTVVRKLQEAYLTWRIEQVLSKARILEIYINMVHWGPGVFGLRQAAEHYFGKPVARLEAMEMALLATLLPNPDRFGTWLKQGWLASSRLTKFEHILSNLRWLQVISPAVYDTAMEQAARGHLAGLSVQPCRDEPPGSWPGVTQPCPGRPGPGGLGP